MDNNMFVSVSSVAKSSATADVPTDDFWKPCGGNYSVSNTGLLRNDVTGNIIKPGYTGWTNYLFYTLYINGLRKQVTAHRLVWLTFMGDIPDGFEINHINHDRHDNRLCNLELCTHRENCQRKSGKRAMKGQGERVSYKPKRPMSDEVKEKHRQAMKAWWRTRKEGK